MTTRLKILFLCTGNSCRSQMAEGWTKHLKKDVIEVFSAGIETHGLNHNAVLVMAEAGVDISRHKSKLLNEFNNYLFDYVITVCGHANETCPRFPGDSKIIHIPFDDPPKMAEKYKSLKKKQDCYRKVRDQIKKYVMSLPAILESENRTL